MNKDEQKKNTDYQLRNNKDEQNDNKIKNRNEQTCKTNMVIKGLLKVV